jgi:hypothetical protein
MGLPRPPGSPITLPATNWSSSLSAAACPIRALAGRKRKSALLDPPRSRTTCENAGLHSGKPPIADKDEVGGSSPPRPTIRLLTSGNAVLVFQVPAGSGASRSGMRPERRLTLIGASVLTGLFACLALAILVTWAAQRSKSALLCRCAACDCLVIAGSANRKATGDAAGGRTG